MARNLYNDEEVTLCTYVAMYDENDLGGRQAICAQTGRSASSISMKIRNIVSTLDKKGIRHLSSSSGLTGRTTGDEARETNWDVIESLTKMSRQDLLRRCAAILGNTG